MVSSRKRKNPDLPEGGAELIKKPVRGLFRGGKGNLKSHPDGSLRDAQGKYAGTDGTNRSGKQAEHDAIKQLEDQGFDVDYGQQRVTTPTDITGKWERTFTRREVGPDGTVTETRFNKGDEFTVPAGTVRNYDGAVKIGDTWKGVETKFGTASRTPQQRAIDTWLNQGGNSMTTGNGRVLEGVQDMRM
jgi:hypothetical protein